GLAEKERLQSPGKERLLVADAEIKTAEAELRLATFDFEATQIRAPGDGTILAKRGQVGDVVGRRQPTHSGTGVVGLAGLRRLEVVVEVPEQDICQVFTGQQCRIEAPVVPTVAYQGKVVRVSPVADSATRCFRVSVEIELPEKDNRLL